MKQTISQLLNTAAVIYYFYFFFNLLPLPPQTSQLPSLQMKNSSVSPLNINTDPGEINGKNWWFHSSRQHNLVVLHHLLTTLFNTPFMALYLNYTQFLSLYGVVY